MWILGLNARLWFWITFIGSIGLDQLVKAWARSAMVERESLGIPFPGFFELTLTYNKGVAFGMFQGLGAYLAPIALLIVVLCIRHSVLYPKEPKIVHISLALLSGGAIGNLIDRVWLGKVTDMFWFRAIDFPVFNIADSCITIAAVLFILKMIFEPKGHTVANQESTSDPAEAKTESDGT